MQLIMTGGQLVRGMVAALGTSGGPSEGAAEQGQGSMIQQSQRLPLLLLWDTTEQPLGPGWAGHAAEGPRSGAHQAPGISRRLSRSPIGPIQMTPASGRSKLKIWPHSQRLARRPHLHFQAGPNTPPQLQPKLRGPQILPSIQARSGGQQTSLLHSI